MINSVLLNITELDGGSSHAIYFSSEVSAATTYKLTLSLLHEWAQDSKISSVESSEGKAYLIGQTSYNFTVSYRDYLGNSRSETGHYNLTFGEI